MHRIDRWYIGGRGSGGGGGGIEESSQVSLIYVRIEIASQNAHGQILDSDQPAMKYRRPPISATEMALLPCPPSIQRSN